MAAIRPSGHDEYAASVATTPADPRSAAADEYIPVVDLAAARAGDAAARHAVAATIDAACRESGFLVVSGHGIDQSLIDEMHRVTVALFEQPDEWKDRWIPPEEAAGLRGIYRRPSYVSALEVATAADLCELFTMSRLGEPGVAATSHLDGAPAGWSAPNIWPDRPADLRAVWLAYYRAMDDLAADLMRLFAIALGLDEHHFDAAIDRHITNLTANHYPPVDGEPLPDQYRKGPHSDWGSLTILYQDGTGGLEVLDRRSGGWVDVPVIEGTFIVNIGDLMATWTNDRWRSTKHRVRVPPPERRAVRRVSIPFFHHPNWDAVIECLPGCAEPGEAPRFAPVTAGEYLLRKVEATYAA
ncbi:MAG: Flavanone 3-dioxygenase [Ilumatobacteraceae bacterium]|nr:Flavanone 3-dioxygenase [Ilumatobacteraceae bacterium]